MNQQVYYQQIINRQFNTKFLQSQMSQTQPDPHQNLKYIEDHDFQTNKVVRYLKGNFLGKGGFARCYELISQQTQQIFAVKIIQKSSLTKAKSKQKLMSEIKIHEDLEHYNIVKFRHHFQDNLNVYIVLELCANKTLNDLIKRKRRLTENEARYFMLQVLEALEYLHQKKIIHRDLKLGNLFLNENMHIKMGDFGLATKISFPGEKRRTICGTPNYIAPQILQSKGHSYEVDVWSFGVIMYTLIYGRPPFQSKDVKQTYKKIKSGVFSFPDNLAVSQSLKDMIISTLQKDPSKRPTIKELKQFSFFQETNLVRQPSLCFKSQSSLSATKERDERQLSDNGKLYTNNELVTSKDTFQKSHDRFLGTERGSSHKRSNTKSNLSRVKSHRVLKQNSERSSVQKTTNFTNQFNGALLESSSNRYGLENTPVKNKSNQNPFRMLETQSDQKMEKGRSDYVSVKKWIDYSSKYGIGYILSNNSFGVFFNDSTKVLSLNEQEFYYIQKMERQDLYKKYYFKDYPLELKKKVSLFIHFKGYLSSQNQNLSPSAFENSSKVNLTAKKMSEKMKTQTPFEKLVYVRRWFRSKHAVIFRLSNKSVQVIFVDQSELLISSLKKEVVYINKKKEKTQYALSDIMSCENKEIIKRFQYTKDILNQMVNVHDKK